MNEIRLRYLLGVLLLVLANDISAQDTINERVNGVSLVSERFLLDSIHVPPIVRIKANYVAVIPYCFMPYKDSGTVFYGDNNQWEGEGLNGTRVAIQELHKQGVKTMIKPQIWVAHGVFTGKIEMKSEEEWVKFEKDYGAYIMAFARIAAEENSAIYCIGTEMQLVVKSRPQLFSRLIKQVREVYKGKLTYAENWDCFENVKFWGELDYIGIDAYFPISKAGNPKKKDLDLGWSKYIPIFDSLSSAVERKIIFTEYGYRSIRKCAATPWSYSVTKKGEIDQRSQVRALTAIYDNIWDQDFFAGGFLWKWYPNHQEAGGKHNSMFTVQNKLAEKTVRAQHLKFSKK
ncbi:MAG: hypothetical protein ACJA0U_002916 [Salibacteraceae bacterium]|jgi:hypothetical protein